MPDTRGSKQAVLDAIRRQQLPPVERPPAAGPWTDYEDRAAQFATVLEQVGGRAVRVADRQQINDHLRQLPAFANAERRVSLVEGVGQPTVDLAAVDDPHALEDIQYAVAPGELAVAENAAVWVTGQAVRLQALYFIVQHLALVVPADRIVGNMHQAYQQIDISRSYFGLFISGPSKTADIEQSLVIGAHGPRSLTVFLLQ